MRLSQQEIDKRVDRVEKLLESILNNYGTRYLAVKLNELYDQYNELAEVSTGGAFKDSWSHKDLLEYLSKKS